MPFLKLIIIKIIKLYQFLISPYLGNNCRYLPTCSEYFIDSLNEYDENLWALAKIKAYQTMNVPFLHVDGDVFIWKPFDSKLLASGLIAQP